MKKTLGKMVALMVLVFIGTFVLSEYAAAAKEISRDGRIIADDNGTVLDTWTNLMWAAKGNGSDINWQSAKSYCENYRGGGYSDWRLPTQGELAVLYDADYGSVIMITGVGVWASETRGSDAALFNFRSHYHYWNPQSYDYNTRTLPVRSGK
ncbi:MAG: DUF1566 domain-containing protein [Syntrophus sp. (in: bacteria)]